MSLFSCFSLASIAQSLKCINSASKELMCHGFVASEWLRPPGALFISRSGNRVKRCSFLFVLLFNYTGKTDNALCHYIFELGPHISSMVSYPFFSMQLSSQQLCSSSQMRGKTPQIPSCITHTGSVSFFFRLTFVVLWCLLSWTVVLVFALWTLLYSPYF